MTFVIKIVKLVIWGILHYRVMGDVYVELLCRVRGSV